jgi:uncharacterized protein YbjT (DUF2867 family)
MPLSVLVTGATGQQGGAVARALRKKGHGVRALTRRPESAAAEELKKLGAEVVAGNTEERASVERAAAGMDAIFSVTDFWGAGFDGEVRQGVAIADAAKNAGIKHLLYTSVPKADHFTGVPHFDSKTKVEQHIRSLGIPYTIMGPCFFMENYLSPWFLPELQQGRLAMPLSPATKLQQIALEDIGAFAAMVLERREEFLGKRIDIASDELTLPATARILSRLSGREIKYVQLDIEQVRQANKEFALMFELYENEGTGVNVPELHRAYPAVGWHNFEQWAASRNWRAVQQPAA